MNTHFFFRHICLICLFPVLSFAQTTVSVDVNTHVLHTVGGSAEFDRSKYMIIHADMTDNEWDSPEQRHSFLEDYDVYFGRNNGTIIWEYNNTREDSSKPGWPSLQGMEERGTKAINNYKNQPAVHGFEERYANMMIGGQEHMFPNGQTTNPPGNSGIAAWAYKDFDAIAEFYANYLKLYFGEGGVTGRPRPLMLEVMNEPFVKANKLGTTRAEITRLHNVVAERVRRDIDDVLIGGYTAAHPAFESNNFNHWRNNWGLFIDQAGENMDFFSFHLYDFGTAPDPYAPEKQRKGSNIEAIMDMINHYSYLRLGEVKPWAISEYGYYCPSCDVPYYAERDWFNIRSFSSMLLQLLERQDQIISAIPFILLKANWAHNKAQDEYNTYSSRLMREIGEVDGEPEHAGWTYTEMIRFFELWRNIKGTRVDTWTSDIDMLADAYIDGNKLYLLISNLEHEGRQLKLNLSYGAESKTPDSIMVKHLYEQNKVAHLDTIYYQNELNSIDIGAEATLILEYTFSDSLTQNATNTETRYYAESYLQAIKANQAVSFDINTVQTTDQGEATLRLGVGRAHGKSLRPQLTLNGTTLPVSTDLKGFDQLTRDEFFGVLEIPVPYELLKENNSLRVSFPDEGGHISSVALQVFNFSEPILRSTESVTKTEQQLPPEQQWTAQPNPVTNDLHLQAASYQEASYQLFNLNGQLLRADVLKGQTETLSLSALSAGTYLLKITQPQGVQTIKIVKQ